MNAKLDQLLNSFKESQKGIEQKEKSVSFDSMEANFEDINARYELKMRQLEEQRADRMKQHADKMKQHADRLKSMEGNFSSEFGNQDVGQDFVQEDADDMQFHLLGSFTELQKGMEPKDRSVSFDSMEVNFGSTSKGGMHAGDGGGFQRLKIASLEECQEIKNGWPDDIGDNIRDNNKVCQAHSSAIAFDLPSDMTFDLPSDMTFESSNTGVLDLLNKAALQGSTSYPGDIEVLKDLKNGLTSLSVSSDVDYLAPSFEGLWATNQFICEICNKGFQEDQNLQLHRRDHDLQWKLPQRTNEDFWVVLNESLPETSGEEGIEKQITSESQGVAIDLLQPNSSERSKEVKVEFDLFGQDEKFEIEEPETSDMDWTTFSVSLEFFHQREVLQSCLMWGGLGLTEPPKEEDWKNAKKIYLMDNELSDLPKNPRCPVLSTLFLQRNYKLRTIPPSFFDHMPSLQILNLSRTGIKSLPESILRLVSLKRLFLNDCHRFMILSPKVGALEQLEVLDLEGTDIMDLPKEIKELTNLTCLEVSFCAYLSNVRRAMQSEVVVPCGIISALSHLEELNMSVNPDDKRWNACVEAIVIEVCTLQSLNNLKFYFPRVELVRHFLLNSPMWVHPSLSHFRFTVGHHVKRTMSRLPHDVEFELEQWERCLKYINGVAIPTEIKEILQYSTAFFLERHATVNKLSDFGIGNMKQLKCCVMGECNEVEVIIDETNARKEDGEADANEDDDEVDACEEDDRNEIVSKTSGAKTIVLGSLEYLYIYYMKNLRRIWEGPAQPKCLSLLKSLTLRTCPQLTTIFTIGLLNNLYNLEELTVEDCPSIKNLVSCENFAEHKTSDFLPNLKRISLHYMPGLISISVGLHIAPRLEWLSFYNCPNLKHLLIEEVSSKALKRIKGEWNWWVALKWRSGRPSYLDDIFVPINI
ncbi:hypothetical protein FH972_022285 [Carpinus fangiana]|uniref:C2H2-type domain-containing protein n=1 Tax=Carpinus fangiana TaxID=176857 RepID=A0A5N6KRT6_9ROSI|nr:hypothetical protein FH972_022285 [Carpinus fangiana]